MSSVSRSAVLRPIYRLFDEGTLVGSSDAELLERFVAGSDERAFEALVTRHGRSVQAVCRDVLRDPHDAEDAFQATFLILARKAGSLWVGNSLAAWLHRVARRVAVEANRQKARRRAVEKTGLDVNPAWSDASTSWGTLPQALHEEIDRLPEKYRTPIILCDLEELTRDEAAHQLGWPPGTVAGRLARARDLLRERLIRRGHAEVGGFVPIAPARYMAHGDVLAPWIRKTTQLITTSPAGTMNSTRLASLGSAVLARGVIRAMMLAKLKTVAVVFVLAAVAPVSLALVMWRTRLEATHSEAALAFQADSPAQAATNRARQRLGRCPSQARSFFRMVHPLMARGCSSPWLTTPTVTDNSAPRRAPTQKVGSRWRSPLWRWRCPGGLERERSGLIDRDRSSRSFRFIAEPFHRDCPRGSCWGRRPERSSKSPVLTANRLSAPGSNRARSAVTTPAYRMSLRRSLGPTPSPTHAAAP